MWSHVWSWLAAAENWAGTYGIPNRVWEHLAYTAATVAIAAAIALPLGAWIGHTGRWRQTVIATTGSMRALPTLGLLTGVVLWQGVRLSAVLIALVVLAVPPILAGTYAGIANVSAVTTDAARAMGMTPWQVLWRVELPLAVPLIIGGLRAAVVQVVATATVAAYVGMGGLGRFLFDGLAVQDYPQMVGGAVIVVAVALLLDGVTAVVQRVATPSHVSVAATGVV